jgi:hypothetical protein
MIWMEARLSHETRANEDHVKTACFGERPRPQFAARMKRRRSGHSIIASKPIAAT